MPLRNIKASERFTFETAADLRDFLNRFTQTDLATVYFDTPDGSLLSIFWDTEVLTDGSEVNNIRIA